MVDLALGKELATLGGYMAGRWAARSGHAFERRIENGQVVSTEGSWEAGVNGAQPGVIMLAHPKTGLTYVQEDAPDVAEGRAKALSLKSRVGVPYGSFDYCFQTLEWSLLEPGVREHKFY